MAPITQPVVGSMSAEELELPETVNDIPADQITTPHLKTLRNESDKYRDMMKDYFDYQRANPSPPDYDKLSKEEKAARQEIDIKLERMRKKMRAQLNVVKLNHRNSVMKQREDKQRTADAKKENDNLLLELSNLKYKEESLKQQIAAAKNYAHPYKKLDLAPVEQFVAENEEFKDASEEELTKARIDAVHRERVKLEEDRLAKLKKKQELIAKKKAGKDKLDKLESSLVDFVKSGDKVEDVLKKPNKAERKAERKAKKKAKKKAKSKAKREMNGHEVVNGYKMAMEPMEDETEEIVRAGETDEAIFENFVVAMEAEAEAVCGGSQEV